MHFHFNVLSPLIKMNGSDLITPIASSSRRASPADRHDVDVIHFIDKIVDHFEFIK